MVNYIRPVLAATLLATFLLTIAPQADAATKKSAKRLGRAARASAEQMLSELGYWTGRVDGVWDAASRHALTAFQKAEGRKATGVLTSGDVDALEAASPVVPREVGEPHFEADLSRQILFFVDENGTVSHVVPISSGNDEYFNERGVEGVAYTPRGRFKVQRKVDGWRRAPLGDLYYPSYLVGGIAVHGSTSIPATPASHGCIRVPMYAARQLSEMMPLGTVVLVYD